MSAGISDTRHPHFRAGLRVQTLQGLMGLRVCLNSALCLWALRLGSQPQNPGFSFPRYFESPGPVSPYFQSSWGRIQLCSFLCTSSFWGIFKLFLLSLVRSAVLGSVAESCLVFCDPVDCSPPGSSVHGILQARILEGVAISSARGSSWPRHWARASCVSCFVKQILYHWATWEALG